ncbi:MAG: Fe2+-dependent dioxygenase [Pseudomonadota bacterium]
MMICLDDVLSPEQAIGLQKTLEDSTLFEPGQRTAGGAAKRAKNNLQAVATRPEIRTVLNQVRERLQAHSEFQRFAMPKHLGRLMVSRYEPGMTYGHHFDAAFIEGRRTDLSFTLFLNDPGSYEGGELEIVTPMGRQAIKLPAGCAIVYPSDHLHGVLPVTQGHRLAVVGWIESRVRLAEHRQTLYDFSRALADLPDADSDAMLRLKMVRNNLRRLWEE